MAGAAGARQPRSFIARGASASLVGGDNCLGAHGAVSGWAFANPPSSPDDTVWSAAKATAGASGDAVGRAVCTGDAMSSPPPERPIPSAQTRPKPVPAQRTAPSSNGRLDFRGATTRSCREVRSTSGTGCAGSCIGGSPEDGTRGSTTTDGLQESPFAAVSRLRQSGGAGEDGNETYPASRHSCLPRWQRDQGRWPHESLPPSPPPPPTRQRRR